MFWHYHKYILCKNHTDHHLYKPGVLSQLRSILMRVWNNMDSATLGTAMMSLRQPYSTQEESK